MAQRREEDKDTIDQVLKLVDTLSPESRAELHQKLEAKAWTKGWKILQEEIETSRTDKGLPSLSDDEIMAEVKAVREQLRQHRAQSGN